MTSHGVKPSPMVSFFPCATTTMAPTKWSHRKDMRS
jgi:hypothetical protein